VTQNQNSKEGLGDHVPGEDGYDCWLFDSSARERAEMSRQLELLERAGMPPGEAGRRAYAGMRTCGARSPKATRCGARSAPGPSSCSNQDAVQQRDRRFKVR
jgi:hypothetical protein